MRMTPEEIALGRNTKFQPDWPPRSSQAPLPKVFSKCHEKFKKVSWPPKDDVPEPEDMPVTNIQLQDEMPLNEERWKPCGLYRAVPPIHAEQPAMLNEDVWPPPEPMDLSERVIHDASRPKRAIRDYTVFFSKNKSPQAGKSYKVPPGTLHVVAERGVLSFDNVDIGRGALAEPPADGSQPNQNQTKSGGGAGVGQRPPAPKTGGGGPPPSSQAHRRDSTSSEGSDEESEEEGSDSSL